jgi:hypothetical protein
MKNDDFEPIEADVLETEGEQYSHCGLDGTHCA